MRIALLTDLHANSEALSACLGNHDDAAVGEISLQMHPEIYDHVTAERKIRGSGLPPVFAARLEVGL